MKISEERYRNLLKALVNRLSFPSIAKVDDELYNRIAKRYGFAIAEAWWDAIIYLSVSEDEHD